MSEENLEQKTKNWHTEPVSLPQITFITTLAKEREVGMSFEMFETMMAMWIEGGLATKGFIGDKIDEWKKLPYREGLKPDFSKIKVKAEPARGAHTRFYSPKKVATPAATGPTTEPPKVEPGYYKLTDGGTEKYYVVVKTKDGERTYAKELTAPSAASKIWTWAYAKGAVSRLKGMTPLTTAEAVKWGKLHGHCIICGKALSDPASVQRGIGPHCAKNLKP